MTKEQIINYCNERIEGLHHEHERSTNFTHQLICLAKQDAYKDVVTRAGYRPRGV